jgi:hypothetical protein
MSDLSEFQKRMRALAEEAGVTDEFVESSNHPYHCRCDKCRDWWLAMGPEQDKRGQCSFGPFGDELWPEYAVRHRLTVSEAQQRCVDPWYGYDEYRAEADV